MTKAADDEIAKLVAKFEKTCRDENRLVTNDGCVRPMDAAALLGKSWQTLERWRTEDRARGKARLPWRPSSSGHCLRYSLLDLAAYKSKPEL